IRREDVTLLTVHIVDQRDAGRAVGIVLDGCDPPRHAELVALEVDDPVEPPRATAAMPGRYMPVRVAAAVLFQHFGERLVWLRRRDLLEGRDGHPTPTRRCWLVLLDRHLAILSRPRGLDPFDELDGVPRLQRDNRLLVPRPLAVDAATSTHLARRVHRVDGG